MSTEAEHTVGQDWQEDVFRVLKAHDVKHVVFVPDAGHSAAIRMSYADPDSLVAWPLLRSTPRLPGSSKPNYFRLRYGHWVQAFRMPSATPNVWPYRFARRAIEEYVFFVAAIVSITFIASMLMPNLSRYGYISGSGEIEEHTGLKASAMSHAASA